MYLKKFGYRTVSVETTDNVNDYEYFDKLNIDKNGFKTIICTMSTSGADRPIHMRTYPNEVQILQLKRLMDV